MWQPLISKRYLNRLLNSLEPVDIQEILVTAKKGWDVELVVVRKIKESAKKMWRSGVRLAFTQDNLVIVFFKGEYEGVSKSDFKAWLGNCAVKLGVNTKSQVVDIFKKPYCLKLVMCGVTSGLKK